MVGQDLVGQRRDRQFAEHLGVRPGGRGPATVRHLGSEAGAAARGVRRGQGLGEHQAARTVEVAGHRGQRPEQPAGHRAERLHHCADPAVEGDAFGAGDLVGESTDAFGRQAGAPGDALRRERRQSGDQLALPAEDLLVERGRSPAGDHGGDQRGQERGVPTRTDSEVLVRHRGGPGAGGVDHDDAPAPLLDRLQPPTRCGDTGGVGHERVGAEQDEQLAPVDVGHRDREGRGVPGAEHEAGRRQHRHVVHGRRGVHLAGPEQLQGLPAVDPRPVVVRERIAEVEANRVRTVGTHEGTEQLAEPCEGLVPSHLDQAVRPADQRPAQPVLVVVQFLERDALGTDEAAGAGIRRVPAHTEDLRGRLVDLDQDPAGRLADRAGGCTDRHERPPMRPTSRDSAGVVTRRCSPAGSPAANTSAPLR